MDRLLLASEILLDIGSRRYLSGLFDRLAGRGHDGNTHAPLLSLADRSAGDHLGHQSLGAFLDPFHAVISIANWGEDQRLEIEGIPVHLGQPEDLARQALQGRGLGTSSMFKFTSALNDSSFHQAV